MKSFWAFFVTQMTQISLRPIRSNKGPHRLIVFLVPQISQINTDFGTVRPGEKGHADYADYADFIAMAYPR